MRHISRIHLHNVGYAQASWFENSTLDLRRPDGSASHTLVSAANGTGKTTVMALAYSCIDTDKDHFLCHLSKPISSYKFDNYFDRRIPGVIAIEWEVDAKEAGMPLLAGIQKDRSAYRPVAHLVTAQIVTRKTTGEIERSFVFYEVDQDLRFEHLPTPSLSGTSLNSRDEALAWMEDFRKRWPGRVTFEETQKRWQDLLRSHRIDPELAAIQVNLNTAEGGIKDFLDFKNEGVFLQHFLANSLKRSTSDSIQRLVKVTVDEMKDLPRLQAEARLAEQLQRAFEEFTIPAETWLRHRDALNEAIGRGARAVAMAKARSEMIDQAVKDADGRIKEGLTAERIADEAVQGATRRVAVAKLAKASLRVRDASSAVDEAQRDLDKGKARRALLEAALRLTAVRSLETSLNVLDEAIRASEGEIAPLRIRLERMGVTLKQKIGEEIGRTEAKMATLSKQAAEAAEQGKGKHAESKRHRADAERLQRDLNRIEQSLSGVRQERERLISTNILLEGESSQTALARLSAERDAAEARARFLEEQVKALDGQAANLVKEAASLTEIVASDTAALDARKKTFHAAVEQAERLSKDKDILQACSADSVDPRIETAASQVAAAALASEQEERRLVRSVEVLEETRRSIQEAGLAGVPNDTLQVVRVLRSRGMEAAQSYAGWLSKTGVAVSQIRSIAQTDPSRFEGVVVMRPEDLKRVESILRASKLQVSRSVSVCLPSEDAVVAPDGRFVLGPEEEGCFDQVAAQTLGEAAEGRIADLQRQAASERARAGRLHDLKKQLDAWRAAWGAGNIEAEEKDISQAEEDIRFKRARVGSLNTEAAECQQKARDRLASKGEAEKAISALKAASDQIAAFVDRYESRSDAWERDAEDLRRRIEESAKAEEAALEASNALRDLASQCSVERASLKAPLDDLQRRQSSVTYAAGEPEDEDLARPLTVLEEDYRARRLSYEQAAADKIGVLQSQREERARQLKDATTSFDVARNTVPHDRRAGIEGLFAEGVTESMRDEAQAMLGPLERAVGERSNALKVAEAERRTAAQNVSLSLAEQALIDSDSEVIDEEVRAADSDLEQVVRALGEVRDSLSQARDEKRRADARRVQFADAAATARSLEAVASTALVHDEFEVPEATGASVMSDAEIGEELTAVSEIIHRLVGEKAQSHSAGLAALQKLQSFTRSAAFKGTYPDLSSEMEAVDFEALCASLAPQKAKISAIAQTSASSITEKEKELAACCDHILDLLREAVRLLGVATDKIRLPENLVLRQFRGQPILKMGFDMRRVAPEVRKSVIRRYIEGLVHEERVPATGADIAAEVIERIARELREGQGGLGIRVLKSNTHGEVHHLPVAEFASSTGEGITSALMLYLLFAKLRAEALAEDAGAKGGAVLLDNPLGGANHPALVEMQIALAEALDMQLVMFSGVEDFSSLDQFNHFVHMRRAWRRAKSGRTLIEVVSNDIDNRPLVA